MEVPATDTIRVPVGSVTIRLRCLDSSHAGDGVTPVYALYSGTHDDIKVTLTFRLEDDSIQCRIEHDGGYTYIRGGTVAVVGERVTGWLTTRMCFLSTVLGYTLSRPAK